MKGMLEEKILETLAGSDTALVKQATDATLMQLSDERRVKLGEHAVAVRIAAEEERLEAALAEHDKALQKATQTLDAAKAKRLKIEAASESALKKSIEAALKTRLPAAFTEIARNVDGTLDKEDYELPEVSTDTLREEEGIVLVWRLRVAYHMLASGRLPVPKDVLDAVAEEKAAGATVERLKTNVVELRRRMQRLSGYERRMRGRLSALALAQSPEGQEMLHALEAIRTEPLPEA